MRIFDVPSDAVDRWTPEAKTHAIALKFYQGHRDWKPQVGDAWCLTRPGFELFQCTAINDGQLSFRQVCSVTGKPTPGTDLQVWRLDEFVTGGFAAHRVPVPYWAWKTNEEIEHEKEVESIRSMP